MKYWVINISLLVVFLSNAVGQTLDDYLIIAGENNPNLRSQFYQYQAALERVPQVGALPDPEISFAFFTMPMERYMGDQIGRISLTQMFPWFGTLKEAKKEMSYMAKSKFEEFNETKSTLFYEVKVNWYALQLLEEEISITQENIDLLKTMEQIANTRFKSGGQSRSSSMTDALKVQMEINELANNLVLLKDNRIPIIANFNQLLNREAHESIAIQDTIMSAELPLSLSEVPDSIKQNNPMLKMLEQEEAAFSAQEKMNKKIGMPSVGLGVQYEIFQPRENSESMMNGRNMFMPMATVTIPLWRKKYTSSVKESNYLRQSIQEQKQDASNQLMVSYEKALKEYRDAERRVKLYKEQTTLATQTLNILIEEYASEGSDFEEVLRMQQQLLDYKLKFLYARIDGNIAVAMMERLMGR